METRQHSVHRSSGTGGRASFPGGRNTSLLTRKKQTAAFYTGAKGEYMSSGHTKKPRAIMKRGKLLQKAIRCCRQGGELSRGTNVTAIESHES